MAMEIDDFMKYHVYFSKIIKEIYLNRFRCCKNEPGPLNLNKVYM